MYCPRNIIVLLLMFAISFSTRFLPFLFAKKIQNNVIIKRLALSLPPCIMLLLIVHSLDGVSFSTTPYALPEMAGILGVASAHLLFHRSLISMTAGIICYQIIQYFAFLN